MRKVHEWDTVTCLGEIAKAPSTFNSVGNANYEGLVIAEGTFGSFETLTLQDGAIIDYGSLMHLTFQRSSNATKAKSTMVQLMDNFGFTSAGESFSISDANSYA